MPWVHIGSHPPILADVQKNALFHLKQAEKVNSLRYQAFLQCPLRKLGSIAVASSSFCAPSVWQAPTRPIVALLF